MKKTLTTAATALLLTACSGGSLSDWIPDRAPDYRQSNVGRKIEVPPDLSNATLDNSLAVSDLNPSSVASYNDYQQARVQRNARGYIEVLPTLYQVQVVEQSGRLPYIQTAADPAVAWQIVKRYWQNNGVRLAIENPQIGIMETDWLENAAGKPSSGIGGMLSNLFGFLRDSDQRDRYRVRLTRNAQGGTDIALIYTKTELVAARDYPLASEPAGFTWQISDTQSPELQLEMTRRIALYLSVELEKSAGISQSAPAAEVAAAPTTPAIGQSTVTTLEDGQPALLIAGSYAQSWRVLGIALDRASFTIDSEQYDTGTYRVRYTPPRGDRSFFARLWGSKDEPENPSYLVRLADRGSSAVAVVQNPDGSNASPVQARALLETVNSAR